MTIQVVVPKLETGKSAKMVATQLLLLRGVMPIIARLDLLSPGSHADHQNAMLVNAIEEVPTPSRPPSALLTPLPIHITCLSYCWN